MNDPLLKIVSILSGCFPSTYTYFFLDSLNKYAYKSYLTLFLKYLYLYKLYLPKYRPT